MVLVLNLGTIKNLKSSIISKLRFNIKVLLRYIGDILFKYIQED